MADIRKQKLEDYIQQLISEEFRPNPDGNKSLPEDRKNILKPVENCYGAGRVKVGMNGV